nr:hypothetical protein [uncultured Actinoplanes sp.]
MAQAGHLGVVYRITQLLRVNVVIEPVNGGRASRINPMYLLPAPEGTAQPPTTTTTNGYHTPLEQGTLVTVTSPKIPSDQLYVVLRDNGDGKASIVRLGGDHGRYWRNVPHRQLTVIDRSRVHLDPPPAG